MPTPINIIDLFAGPGGLGEGFSSYRIKERDTFRIRMSVEKEESAHKTLTLRALYRVLSSKTAKKYYHGYLAGEISKEELTTTLHHEWRYANGETMHMPTALGEDNEVIHKRLRELKHIHANEPWIVIGGPPCQAYSLVGRSRNKGIKGYRPEADHRHFLYQEYLRVLDIIQPDVFVMENVKGILTSTIANQKIFPKIREDLEHPSAAIRGQATKAGKRYRIYSLIHFADESGLWGPKYFSDSSYIVKAENYGVPQARHRVILLGVSEEINRDPDLLQAAPNVNIEQVLAGLPALRSKLSKTVDSPENWAAAVRSQALRVAAKARHGHDHSAIAEYMVEVAGSLKSEAPTSSMYYPGIAVFKKEMPTRLAKWLLADAPKCLPNHESRGHIPEDLGRYLFSACWAELSKDGGKPVPNAKDFPRELWPNHSNWQSGAFADRFRVQAKGRPATTITSHISKDGHYFIHFDARQCRSLTVREAARIQTFPDNYFFEGNRTQQYVQVGNAVPPFLARQIAELVYKLFL